MPNNYKAIARAECNYSYLMEVLGIKAHNNGLLHHLPHDFDWTVEIETFVQDAYSIAGI